MDARSQQMPRSGQIPRSQQMVQRTIEVFQFGDGGYGLGGYGNGTGTGGGGGGRFILVGLIGLGALALIASSE